MENDSLFDLRISFGFTLLITSLLGPIIYLILISLGYPSLIIDQEMTVTVFLLLSCVVSLFLKLWNESVAKWFLVFSISIFVLLAGIFWESSFFLMLASVPVGLSAVLIGINASFKVALIETLVLILFYLHPSAGFTIINFNSSVLFIWLIYGFLYAAYRPILTGIAQWQQYARQAHTALDEARNRQSQLNQALDDLADAHMQLKRVNNLVDGLRRASDEARMAKEQFVANVSHELRTPLNMVIGFSEMILQSPESYGEQVPKSLLSDLVIIQRNATHLSELIDDVLDLSQVDAGVMALTKMETYLDDLIESATIAVRPLFDSKGLSISKDIAADLPLVFCDPTRIREVILNLLSNAGRFTERGGVHIRAWQEKEDVIVSFADTGPGIDSTRMDLLFQPFQQLDGTIHRRYGGTGLGLSISKRFVELHGGKIWVDSEMNVGTTFSFLLPMQISQPSSSGYRRALAPGWEFYERTSPSLAPKVIAPPRIMVVDPDGSLQRILQRYLGTFEVMGKPTLDEAVQSMAENPCQTLLINNTSLAASFQSMERLSLPYPIPVIFCAVPEIYEVRSQLGISDYLIKPISRADLLEAVERYKLDGNTILIVDDEPEALRLFRRMLTASKKGYRVLRARDGVEAMSICKNQHPDLILIDLVMPNMDGFRFLEERSHNKELSSIPVIIISARDPLGQPIVSNMIAVTLEGGLSIHHLLQYIKMTNAILSPQETPNGRVTKAASPD